MSFTRTCSGATLVALVASWASAGAVLAADMEDSARNASIAGIHQALTDHTYTVTDLASFYVMRIGAIDQNGPALHSILEVNPDWERLARDMDQELKSGRDPLASKPLFGIPI